MSLPGKNKVFVHTPYTGVLGEAVAEQSPNGRLYRTPEGNLYPSVTTFLGWRDREYWEEWRKKNPGVSEAACQRGTEIHDSLEKLIQGHLKNVVMEVQPSNRVMFDTFRRMLNKHVDNIIAQEVALYSDTLRLAGRCDLIAEWNGVPAVIDFKTARKMKREEWIGSYFLQISCYALMWRERTGQAINTGVVLIGSDNSICQPFVFDVREHYVELKQRIIEFRKEFGVEK